MIYILYNKEANNNCGENSAQIVKEKYEEEVLLFDVTTIEDYPAFLAKCGKEDTIVLVGGDGTLQHFANDVYENELPCKVLLYPGGSGNDFYHDRQDDAENDMICINSYIKKLPTVTVNGKNVHFVNGIGYGIDGYCCEVGDKLKEKSDKPINYASIAIKGLLFHFHPLKAVITVDGEKKEYNRVWLAPTMKGRFYGGGMMIAPAQDRNKEGVVTNVVLYNAGKIKTLIVFPSIFKGEHIKHEKMVDIRSGHQVTVEFDRPTALQIDGETVLNVTTYTVTA